MYYLFSNWFSFVCSLRLFIWFRTQSNHINVIRESISMRWSCDKSNRMSINKWQNYRKSIHKDTNDDQNDFHINKKKYCWQIKWENRKQQWNFMRINDNRREKRSSIEKNCEENRRKYFQIEGTENNSLSKLWRDENVVEQNQTAKKIHRAFLDQHCRTSKFPNRFEIELKTRRYRFCLDSQSQISKWIEQREEKLTLKIWSKKSLVDPNFHLYLMCRLTRTGVEAQFFLSSLIKWTKWEKHWIRLNEHEENWTNLVKSVEPWLDMFFFLTFFFFECLRMSSNVFECLRMSSNVFECLRMSSMDSMVRFLFGIDEYVWQRLRNKFRLFSSLSTFQFDSIFKHLTSTIPVLFVIEKEIGNGNETKSNFRLFMTTEPVDHFPSRSTRFRLLL